MPRQKESTKGRAAPPEGRRDQIINAAAVAFRQRGYSGTTVRDLAKEIGLTSGSLFHHFQTKEEILLCVVERGLAQSMDRIEAEVPEDADPRTRVEHMIRAHLLTLLEGSAEATSVLFHEQWALSDATLKRMIELRDGYEAVWDGALEQLGGRFSDPSRRRLLRLLLFGSMNWSVQWYHQGGEFDVDDITRELSHSLIDANAESAKGADAPSPLPP